MGNPIDICDASIKRSSHHTQKDDMLLSKSQMMTLGNVLSLYGEISTDALERLAKINVQNMELKRNQKLYSLCQGRAEIFLVKLGWVSLCHSAKSNCQNICNVYMLGDIVGIRESFFDNHDITIHALECCQLEKLAVDDLHAVFKDCADVKKAVISYIMVNDNISIERLKSFTHHRAEERVAHFLLEIYARYNFNNMIDSNVLYFPITQEVVGELLGITSVHVSRCMTALEQKN